VNRNQRPTIAFYSYKGGVGRSLAVANLAGFLAQFGFRLAVIDLDLEAPGLHYKFSLLGEQRPMRGLTHFLATAADGHIDVDLLDSAIVPVIDEPGQRAIYLLPAGDASMPEYWRDLARIRWDLLFDDRQSIGPDLMTLVRDRLGEAASADFVLVDSRTGISLSAGVATSMLADVLVLMFLFSDEHLDGTIAVAREAVRSNPALSRVVPVASRISSTLENEQDMLGYIHQRMTDGLTEDEARRIEFPLVIHSSSDLASREFLLFGSTPNVADSRERGLLNDYVRLFASLTNEQFSGERLGAVRSAVRARLLDDPEDAARTLESLVAITEAPEVMEDLIKLYDLTKDGSSLVTTVIRLWTLNRRLVTSREVTNALVRVLSPGRRARPGERYEAAHPQFVAEYLASLEEVDDAVAAVLIGHIATFGDLGLANQSFEGVAGGLEDPAGVLANVIGRLSAGPPSQERDAGTLAAAYMERFGGSPEFVNAATVAARYTGGQGLAESIVESPAFVLLDPDDRFLALALSGRAEAAAEVLLQFQPESSMWIDRFDGRHETAVLSAVLEIARQRSPEFAQESGGLPGRGRRFY
jgi:hypothetical protein